MVAKPPEGSLPLQLSATTRSALKRLSAGQTNTFGSVNSLLMTRYCHQALFLKGDVVFMVPSLLTSIRNGRFPDSWSCTHCNQARPTCLRLLTQLTWAALALALAKAGKSKAARMAMMAMTTSSSMSVNATRRRSCLVFMSFSFLVYPFILFQRQVEPRLASYGYYFVSHGT